MVKRMVSVLVLVAAMTGVSYAEKSEDANITLCKRLYSEINKGNLGVFDELASEKFVEHEVVPGFPSTRDGVKAFFAAMRTAFPDLTFNVEFYIANDDKVATYLTMNGTQKGEFMGHAATGNKINVKGVDILQIKDGKVVAHWGVTDSMAMMEQLAPDKAE
jgi:steroid delta-isomerase-like uncharacterized protein